MTPYAKAQQRNYGLSLVRWVRTVMTREHTKLSHTEQRPGDEPTTVWDQVCAKWQDKTTVDNCGRTVVLFKADLHPVISCTCGADEANKKVNQVCDELQRLLLEVVPPAEKPKRKKK